MSTGTKLLDNTVLHQFLGADGVEELKSKIIDMIVEEIRHQLKSSNYYIISPDDIANDIYKDVISDISEEIKAEYKERIQAAINSKMTALGI